MKRNLISAIIFLSAIFWTACSTDIDYTPPTLQRSMVIYSVLKKDSTLNVLVTSTQNMNDTTVAYISDASVNIFTETGELCGTAEYTEKGVYVSDIKIEANKKYTIKADAPGYLGVSATDYAPESVEIKSATYLGSYEYDAINDVLFGLVTLKFSDNPDERNFYEIILLHMNEDRSSFRIFPFSVSNEFVYANSDEQNNPQSILFDDALCNGQEITLNIKVQTSSVPYIILRNTTETYYKYQKSLYTYLFTQPEQNDRVFTIEPINLYSNVKNGYGSIVGYGQSEYQSIAIGGDDE